MRSESGTDTVCLGCNYVAFNVVKCYPTVIRSLKTHVNASWPIRLQTWDISHNYIIVLDTVYKWIAVIEHVGLGCHIM